MQKIVVDEISKKEYPKCKIVEQVVYVNCECNSLDHIARFIVQKNWYQESGSIDVDVFFETNGALYVAPYRGSTNRFIYWFQHMWAKVKKAVAILFKREVYFGVDFFVNGETGQRLVEELGASIKRVSETPVVENEFVSEVSDEKENGVCSE